MLERQEIDALLISSLYGELTPSEETRLAAHLESHPTDKSALAAMTSTREAVRESRILTIQLDPPQSISALLLQEAARRAPKQADEREGWFARLARSFMAHPAMAAAAMLVVVIGVATLVNTRKGDQFSESTAPAVTNQAQPSGGVVAHDQSIVAEPPAAKGEKADHGKNLDDGIAAGSGSAAVMQAGSDAYRVDLAEPSATGGDVDRKIAEERVRREVSKGQLAKQEASVAKIDADESATKGKDKVPPSPKKSVATKAPSGPYMELRTADPAVKDFEGNAPATQGRAYNYETDLDKEQQTNAITPGPSAAPGAPNTGYARTNGDAVQKAAPKDPAPPNRQQPDAPKTAQNTNTTAKPPATKAEVRSIDATSTTGTTTPRGATPTPPTVSRNTPNATPTPTSPPRNAPAQPAPPPPAKVGAAAGSGGTSNGVARDDRAGEKPRTVAPTEDKASNDPQLAWAREQHTAILAQVRAGNCKGAANIAVNLANRDRAYYEQNVATDRSVKECLAYIDNAREKDAEQRAERVRATQKRANEPAKRNESKAADAKAADSVK